MKRILIFAKRNITEILRDPMSYIFCLGFPIIMLIAMTLVNESIPKEVGMTIFRIDNLAGGILVFGQTFIMLFSALTVSHDRCSSFLIRMFASPMKSGEFVLGYVLPLVMLSLFQAIITVASSFVISLITGVSLSIWGLLFAVLMSIPSALFFVGIGVIFGTLLSEKAAPGLCSIVISLGCFLGGIWFDAEGTGGVLYKICKAMPFIYCTKTVRGALALNLSWEGFGLPLTVTGLSAAAAFVIAALAFKGKMKADLA